MPINNESGEIHVRDYGAVGDNSADDTIAFQTAFAMATPTGKVVILEAGKTYKITAALRLGTGTGAYVRLEGRGATIQCHTACSEVIRIEQDVAVIRDLHIGAGRCANYGVFLSGGSTSYFENVDVYQAVIDGFHSDFGNDRCMYLNCFARLCGTIFHTSGYTPAPANIKSLVTATMAKTSGLNCVVSVDSGTFNFNTAGTRPGDLISLHATTPGVDSAEWLQIDSIAPDGQSVNIDSHIISSEAASGLQFSLHVGDGYHEGPGRADNNINNINNFLGENCAGSAIRLGGLYGARCTNIQVNAAFAFPVSIGSPQRQTIVSTFNGVYFEFCEPRNNFYFAGAAGFSVDGGNVSGVPFESAAGFSWGTLSNMQNASDIGRIDRIGSEPRSYIPAMRIGGVKDDLRPENNCVASGIIHSRSYKSALFPGGGSLELSDYNTNLAPVEIVSGVSWYYTDAVSAVSIDTDYNLTNTSAVTPNETNLPVKNLLKIKNFGAFKFGVGVYGDVRTVSVDKSDSPGDVTTDLNSSPSGRFAMASATATVTITNRLCVASTKVFLSKLTNDATATDFKVVANTGSFTVTANYAATAAVTFDYFLVNASS